MTKYVLATIFATVGLVGAFYAYSYLSPRIQRPQPQSAKVTA